MRIALNMRATLTPATRSGFSETARSRPGHREAGRDGRRVGAGAVGGRGLADDPAERAAERPEAHEADVEADLGDGAIGLPEQRHRPFDAAALQVPVRGLAEGGAKRPDEMAFG